MKRLNDATVSATPPTPPAAGTEGYPTNGNPIGPVPATDIPDWFLALVQEHARGQGDIAGITSSMTGYAEGAERLARVAAAKVISISATRALTLADQGVLQVSAASANVALTLPAANIAAGLTLLNGAALPTVTPRFRIIRTDSSGNTLTVVAPGGNTIDRVVSLPPGAIADVWSDASSVWQVAILRGRVVEQSWATPGTYTFTVPAGVYEVFARLWGGGASGGGGSASANGYAGEGGGGGAAVEGWLAVTPGASMTVVVGAAGAAPTSASDGAAGGASTFGGLSAGGGTAGRYTIHSSTAERSGGTASGGSINRAGGKGGIVLLGPSGAGVGGAGGNAAGGGGQGGVRSSGGPSAGLAPGGGGGGGGGAASSAGGVGAAGLVYLQYRVA